MEPSNPTSQQAARPGRGLRTLAVVLSILAPGAGHFLIGRFRRGAVWALAVPTLASSVLLAVRGPHLVRGALLAIGISLVGRVIAAIECARLGGVSPTWKWVVLAWALLLATDLTVFESIKRYIKAESAQAFRMPTGSMQPALLVGDYFVTDKTAYRSRLPERGEIVLFVYPPDERQQVVKRVVALPGETVQVRGGRVIVNDQPLPEPYASATAPDFEPVMVPPGSYFLLGDDRENSQDSRHWGFIPREKILGRASLIYWSWDPHGFRPRFDRVNRKL